MRFLALYISLLFSPCCFADAAIHIFDESAVLKGDCGYYARDIKSAGFSCSTDQGEFYGGAFKTAAEVIASFSESQTVSNNEKDPIDASVKVLTESLNNLTHHFLQLNSGLLEGYKYAVCDAESCLEITALKIEIIRDICSQLGIELINGL